MATKRQVATIAVAIHLQEGKLVLKEREPRPGWHNHNKCSWFK